MRDKDPAVPPRGRNVRVFVSLGSASEVCGKKEPRRYSCSEDVCCLFARQVGLTQLKEPRVSDGGQRDSLSRLEDHMMYRKLVFLLMRAVSGVCVCVCVSIPGGN